MIHFQGFINVIGITAKKDIQSSDLVPKFSILAILCGFVYIHRHESGRGKNYLRVSQSKGRDSLGHLGSQKLKGSKCLLLLSVTLPGVFSSGLKWLFFPLQKVFTQ